VLKALDVEGPIYAFELWLESVPEAKRKAAKTRAALPLSPFMPVRRDFAFVVDRATTAGDSSAPFASADRALIAEARVFDLYEGPGVPQGAKSLAVEIILPAPRGDPHRRPDRGRLGQCRGRRRKAVGAVLRS